MIKVNFELSPETLRPKIERLFELSAVKLRAIEEAWNPAGGPPVVTVRGLYTPRKWTDWTRGFQYGSALVQFDAAGDSWFLDCGRRGTLERMEPYIAHFGVHDHGFNIISSFGNLARLEREGKIEATEWEQRYYGLALKTSGAVQAARWSRLAEGGGYVYSFNGPHSLFIDTLRSLRSLGVAHRLGQALHGESGQKVSLLSRLVQHARATAEFSVYYGEGRDRFDVRGRVAHESLFNVPDGSYRSPATQQGYSPFTTWTRGLGWAILGFAEQLEFLRTVPAGDFAAANGGNIEVVMLKAVEAAADYYLSETPTDGIPYWDTGAPNLEKLGDYRSRASDPFNDFEPVDSSAAAVAAQGLWRLGNYLAASHAEKARRYRQAALTITQALADEPYLSSDPAHQGLILHSVYHRPRGWDYVPPGRKVPCGESSMWGDYHARELGLLLLREARREPYLNFFNV